MINLTNELAIYFASAKLNLATQFIIIKYNECSNFGRVWCLSFKKAPEAHLGATVSGDMAQTHPSTHTKRETIGAPRRTPKAAFAKVQSARPRSPLVKKREEEEF